MMYSQNKEGLVTYNALRQVLPCWISHAAQGMARDHVNPVNNCIRVFVRDGDTRTPATSILDLVQPDDRESPTGSVLPEPWAWTPKDATTFRPPKLEKKDGCWPLGRPYDPDRIPDGEQVFPKVTALSVRLPADPEERATRRFPCFGCCLKRFLTRRACESSAALTWDFQFQCFAYSSSLPRASEPEERIGPEYLNRTIENDQMTLAPENSWIEWELPNEFLGELPPSDEKTWMFGHQSYPLKRPWPSYDWPANHRQMYSVVAITTEPNKLVSSILDRHVHPFSFHADSDAKIALWLRKLLELLRHSNRLDKAEDPTRRVPPVPDFRPTAASATLTSPLCSWRQHALHVLRFEPIFLENMRFHACLCALLLGFAVASPAGLIHQGVILGSIAGLIPIATADRFTLRNGYGTVEARYHLTAYDCSDPSEVQAYSSIPANHCNTRATPVRMDRPT